eukprot:jgi/Chrzof1/7974/UNPLg00898.t1
MGSMKWHDSFEGSWTILFSHPAKLHVRLHHRGRPHGVDIYPGPGESTRDILIRILYLLPLGQVKEPGIGLP